LNESPVPIVAAVDGVAAGIGCDIALACDIRLASDTAVFCEIFGQVGLLPDGGGTFNLPRIVGLGRAMEMALTCQNVRAEQALEWGMVTHIYPADAFKQHVQSYVERLAYKAPLAVARTKQAIREAVGNFSFADAIKRESELQKDLFVSRDFKEGVNAFLQKRSPNFRGS
jgi:2-(1,2-epoxy-1,2-dihydrophenyl)acetyl-CoA isomerase